VAPELAVTRPVHRRSKAGPAELLAQAATITVSRAPATANDFRNRTILVPFQARVSVTRATPRLRMPSSRAAALDRSMRMVREPGRSFMITTTDSEDPSSVTRTRVPIGSHG
jgi:hypothetical protein